MDYKKLIKSAFSEITPVADDEQFRKTVLERTKIMNKKRISFKKPAVAICAAVAAAALGVTGAAAMGIIDFNELFGNRIRVENEQLGEILIGNADSVKWSVSDDDYVVNIKGVTGTENSTIAVIEIARADGTPVKEYFKNTDLLAKTNLSGCYSECKIDDDYASGVGAGFYEYVNDKGNIEISIEFSGVHNKYNISGKKISLSGIGFYPAHDFIEGKVPREKTAFMAYGGGEYQLTEDERAYLDSIAVLNLEWSIEFTYNPSSASVDSLSAKDLSEKTTFTCDIGEYKGEEFTTVKKDEKFEVAFDEILINSLGGRMTGEMQLGELGGEQYFFSLHRSDMKIKLLDKNGAEMNIMVLSGSGTSNTHFETGVVTFSFELEFHANGGQTAVDLSEIGAISINDAIYELE